MSDAYLKTSNLTVGYGKRIVVDGIEISLEAGSIVTLIGPNGSGKSTILKTISNVLMPLGGSIYLGGMDLRQKSREEVSREMAVMYTGDSLRERLNCREVVSLGRYPYTGLLGRLTDHDLEMVDMMMKETDVDSLSERYFGEISDGQKQRVLLARALCQEPQLLILDEPTTYLDIKYKLEFLALLRRQAREKGISILLSLHELDLARQISDRVVCVKDGHVVKNASPDEVFIPGYINELFDIRIGTYDEITGEAKLKD